MPQLTLENLACRRAGRLVVSGVDVTVRSGEALLVTGRNGAGKSTLLAAVAGLLRPASGTVTLSGAGDRPRSASLHHLGHRDGLKLQLTALENLAFAAAVLGAPALPPAAALERLGLGRAGLLPVGYLSAGQRRRVTLARLLVARRPLWLLDEPATALDRDGQRLLLAILDAHLAEGGLVMAATHSPLPVASARELALAGGAAAASPA